MMARNLLACSVIVKTFRKRICEDITRGFGKMIIVALYSVSGAISIRISIQ